MGQKEQAARAVNLRAMELIRDGFEKSSGMTQQQLADDSGIPRSTLANILSRSAEPRLIHVEQLVRLALALGADPRRWIAELQEVAKQDRADQQRSSVASSLSTLAEERQKRRPAGPAKKAARKPHTPRPGE